MKNKLSISGILAIISLLFVQSGFGQISMVIGYPVKANGDTVLSENYLMEKPQYSLSYNNKLHIPNWVSWHVDATDFGPAKRQSFHSDTTLPAGWYQVSPDDYDKSGFDKGHQCPSADRTFNTADNSATFLMTNMIPQAPNNNRIIWKNMEAYSRNLVNQKNELYIICGIYGQGGTGSKGPAKTIRNNISVPERLWKIVVVLPLKTNISDSTRIIAVLMPNTQTCSKKSWQTYRVSVDDVEKLTGYDFLSNVPKQIQKIIEAKVDNVPIY